MGGGRLDDAKQAIGACAIGLALLAVLGRELQAVSKRCGLANLGNALLFSLACDFLPRVRRAASTYSSHPVFNFQRWDFFKMAGVVGDECEFFGQGVCRNLGIKIAHRRSIAAQIGF